MRLYICCSGCVCALAIEAREGSVELERGYTTFSFRDHSPATGSARNTSRTCRWSSAAMRI